MPRRYLPRRRFVAGEPVFTRDGDPRMPHGLGTRPARSRDVGAQQASAAPGGRRPIGI
jgi:hypothetical protein